MNILLRLTANLQKNTDPPTKADPCNSYIPPAQQMIGLIENIYWKPELKDVAYYKINNYYYTNKPVLVKHKYNGVRGYRRSINEVEIISTSYLYGIDFILDFSLCRKDILSKLQEDNFNKHCDILDQRTRKEQYKKQLYLGARECGVSYTRIYNLENIEICNWTQKFGLMYWRIKYDDIYIDDKKRRYGKRSGVYMWENACVKNGVVICPSEQELKFRPITNYQRGH